MLACKKKMKNQFVDAYQITLKPEENERIHVHDFYEVILCLKGEMLCQVEDKQYEMREGDLISVYPGEMHQMQVQEKSICEFYMLHVNLDLTRQFEMISPDIRMRYNEKRQHILVHTHGMRYAQMEEIFKKICQEEKEQGFGWETLMYAYEVEIITNVARIDKEGTSAYGKPVQSSTVDQMIRYINEHLSNELTVSEIADTFYISESYVSQLFHRHLGVSPHRFIMKKRMVKARRLLLDGENIQQILPIVGYQDYSAFLRAFKLEYGMTPGRYKKEWENGHGKIL